MIIRDDVKNFKKFLETCSTKGLFGAFYTKVEDGSFTTSLISVTKSCGVKVKYTPREVKVDASLNKVKGSGKKAVTIYEDGELWCDPSRILGKMDNMRAGEVSVEFDGEKLHVKCGRADFLSDVFADKKEIIKSRDVEGSNADIPESMMYDDSIKMGRIEALSKVTLDHRIVVDSSDIQGLAGSRSKLASASNFQFLVKDGDLSVSVVDTDDKSGKPDYFKVDFGEMEGWVEGVDFKLLYMVGVSEMFANLPGEVELFLGANALFPMMLHKVFVENIKEGKESLSRQFLDVLYMNMPYSEPVPIETGEDLEKALEESDAEDFEAGEFLDDEEDNDWEDA